MPGLKILPRYLCAILFFSLFIQAKSVHAQRLRLVYDERTESLLSKTPSAAEERLVRRSALPKARRIWRGDESCREDFGVVGAASGSFTKPGAAQRAILYCFCEIAYSFANNGIVIVEGGSVVAHVLYEGGKDHEIGAVADINNNGLSEIVIGAGGTYQGHTVSVVKLIELSRAGVKKFGIADVYADDCGATEECTMTAHRISTRPGRVPVFYRETYRKRNGRWIKAGKPVRYSLRRSRIKYAFVN